MKKAFALASLSLVAVGIAYSSLSLGASPTRFDETEYAERKRLFVEQLRTDNAVASPELICTATSVSDETSRTVYEAVLFGRTRVSQAAADAVSEDLVNTFVNTCRGNPNDLEPIIQRGGGAGLYHVFAGAMAVAGR